MVEQFFYILEVCTSALYVDQAFRSNVSRVNLGFANVFYAL